MNSAVSYWIEITGTALVLLWIFRNPQAFESMTNALGGTAVNATRALQGRGNV